MTISNNGFFNLNYEIDNRLCRRLIINVEAKSTIILNQLYYIH